MGFDRVNWLIGADMLNDLPKWHEMGEGIAIPSIPVGKAIADPITHVEGGYRPDRNL